MNVGWARCIQLSVIVYRTGAAAFRCIRRQSGGFRYVDRYVGDFYTRQCCRTHGGLEAMIMGAKPWGIAAIVVVLGVVGGAGAQEQAAASDAQQPGSDPA